jgi:hypothetical protein
MFLERVEGSVARKQQKRAKAQKAQRTNNRRTQKQKSKVLDAKTIQNIAARALLSLPPKLLCLMLSDLEPGPNSETIYKLLSDATHKKSNKRKKFKSKTISKWKDKDR